MMQCATIYIIVPIEIKFWYNSGLTIGMTNRFSFLHNSHKVASIFKSNDNSKTSLKNFIYLAGQQGYCYLVPQPLLFAPPPPKKKHSIEYLQESNLILRHSHIRCIPNYFPPLDISPPTIPLSQITYTKENMSSQIWESII